MPPLHYGNYTLISRPRYDRKLNVWRSYASVTWDNGKFSYHQINDLEKTFETGEEALAFGFFAARAWIAEYEAGRATPSK